MQQGTMNTALEVEGLQYRGLNCEWELGIALFGLENAHARDKLYLIKDGKKICIVTVVHDLVNNVFNLTLKKDGRSEIQVDGVNFPQMKTRIQDTIDSYARMTSGSQMNTISAWMALDKLLTIIDKH